MKYRFEINYIPRFLININQDMQLKFPDTEKFSVTEEFTFSHDQNFSVDHVKDDLRNVFEKNDCQILKIEGGIVE